MRCVVQRVTRASVRVAGRTVGEIGPGLLVLAGVAHDDTERDLRWMAEKLPVLRVFPSGEKHFELSVRDIGGAILLVSNFTVCAATRKGRRPSLDGAAPPEKAKALFERFEQWVRETGVDTQTGEFAASMQVDLVNNGPATFVLDSAEARPGGR